MGRKQETLWRCQNYGACARADESTAIPLATGEPFRCPECGGEEGIQLKTPGPKLPIAKIAVISGGVALLALVIKLLTPPEAPPVQPPPRVIAPPIVDKRTAIDRQILTRPDSKLYEKPDGPVAGNRLLKNFERFFVFGEKDGWIEVGESRDQALGWMKVEDTVDWPHSIVFDYANQEKRGPALFFRDQKALEELTGSGAGREDNVVSLYQEIEEATDRGQPPGDDFPVVCMEPSYQGNQIYINPVLESHSAEVDGKPARILKVTAAGEERGATRFSSPEYLKTLQRGRQTALGAKTSTVKGVDVDLVFVIDMTGTMQPWVDGLFSAMRELTTLIEANPRLKGRVRLGLWGYQDNPGYRGIQYLTKNYTPSLLDPAAFASLLEGIKVNKLTPDGYPEDVFSGVTAAIGGTSWRSGNRFLMLIGDAPGHTSTKAGGATDIDAPQVRQIADDAGVQIVSLSILDSSNPDFIQYHPLLQSQFKTLARNGNRAPAFLTVNSSEGSVFRSRLDNLLGELVRQKSVEQSDLPPAVDPAEQIARGLLEGAVVRVVAQEVDEAGEIVVPRDITGWVLDRDLINPDITSLEPKLLVTRSELNKLLNTAEGIIKEAEAAKIVGGNFYDSVLKAVAGAASGDRSERLKDRLPDFIRGLPYRSEFMEKSRDWWANATSEESDRFIAEMKAKLSYYREVNENPQLWKPLNRDAPSGSHVAEIPLSQLL